MLSDVYITGYSFNTNAQKSIEELENSITSLGVFVNDLPPQNARIIASDLLDHRVDVFSSINDLILDVSNGDSSVIDYLLGKLEKVVGKFLRNKQMLYIECIDKINNSILENEEFTAFYTSRYFSPDCPIKIHVSNVEDVFNLDCKMLEEYPISSIKFINKSKILFKNLFYHDGLVKSLDSVVNGDYTIYTVEFVRALRALNNSFPLLSNEGHNPPDLKLIKEQCGLVGRTMDCTPQGVNKDHLVGTFIVNVDGEIQTITVNCEYHLKINFDNTGNKIDGKYYNRAYFGLPLLNSKKYICLFYLGSHQ